MGTCKLDVLSFRDANFWVGQCLQHDIAVQGGNLRDCVEQFRGGELVDRVCRDTRPRPPVDGRAARVIAPLPS